MDTKETSPSGDLDAVTERECQSCAFLAAEVQRLRAGVVALLGSSPARSAGISEPTANTRGLLAVARVVRRLGTVKAEAVALEMGTGKDAATIALNRAVRVGLLVRPQRGVFAAPGAPVARLGADPRVPEGPDSTPPLPAAPAPEDGHGR